MSETSESTSSSSHSSGSSSGSSSAAHPIQSKRDPDPSAPHEKSENSSSSSDSSSSSKSSSTSKSEVIEQQKPAPPSSVKQDLGTNALSGVQPAPPPQVSSRLLPRPRSASRGDLAEEIAVASSAAKNADSGMELQKLVPDGRSDDVEAGAPIKHAPGLTAKKSMMELIKREAPASKLGPCPPVTVTVHKLSYAVKTNPHIWSRVCGHRPSKTILQDTNALVKPGEMLAIIGPSGCGKTTLLDFIGTRIESGSISGGVSLNGRPLTDRIFRSVGAYVPQEDHLFGDLTVRETFEFAANLAMPSSVSPSAKRERIETLVDDLGLRVCVDSYVGTVFRRGISGGQKRRVSIGVELVTNPSLIILDEPTSGLDSSAAFNIVTMLRRIADAGRTVVATVHQPSSEVLHLFDKVMLMTAGSVVYFGPVDSMLDYFAAPPLNYPCPQYTNPADFLLYLVNTDFPGHGDAKLMVETYASSALKSDLVHDIESLEQGKEKASFKDPEKPGPMRTFAVMTWRALIYQMRNPGVYWVRLAMYIMLSLMIGTIYLRIGHHTSSIQDRISLLFYVCAFMVFMSIAVLPSFLLDRNVFVRERSNGLYGPLSYVIANTVVAVPGILAIALSASVIVYWMVGLNDSFVRFVWFTVDLFLSLFVAEGLILLVSALVPFFIIGIAVAAGIYGMFMLTEGFFVIRSNIPGWWIWSYYIGFHTYSFDAFMYNEFSNQVFYDSSTNTTITGASVLSTYSMQHDHRSQDMGILISMAIIYRIMFYLALKVLHKGKR